MTIKIGFVRKIAVERALVRTCQVVAVPGRRPFLLPGSDLLASKAETVEAQSILREPIRASVVQNRRTQHRPSVSNFELRTSYFEFAISLLSSSGVRGTTLSGSSPPHARRSEA
jgi:hypothetical protein